MAFHNAQLEASAFREEFDPESFEDLTLPKYDMIHKVRPARFLSIIRRVHILTLPMVLFLTNGIAHSDATWSTGITVCVFVIVAGSRSYHGLERGSEEGKEDEQTKSSR